MDKVRAIVSKEWSEVFQNKLVLFTVLFLPLILALMPMVMLVIFNRFESGSAAMSDPEIVAMAGELCAGLDDGSCMIVWLLNLFVMMFMILPVAIPVSIAAYSVVGEKTSRSLEPLLATPITTLELLSGKMLAAVVPAVLATWVAFALFLAGAWFLTDEAVFASFLQPYWFVAIFALAPLLTLLSTSIAVIISSRATDPRVAEQLSALVLLPVMLVAIGQSVGLILINQQVMLLIFGVVLVADVTLAYLAVRLFDRETILTRWK